MTGTQGKLLVSLCFAVFVCQLEKSSSASAEAVCLLSQYRCCIYSQQLVHFLLIVLICHAFARVWQMLKSTGSPASTQRLRIGFCMGQTTFHWLVGTGHCSVMTGLSSSCCHANSVCLFSNLFCLEALSLQVQHSCWEQLYVRTCQ